jgi:sugar phosphate isomerase/epimerase
MWISTLNAVSNWVSRLRGEKMFLGTQDRDFFPKEWTQKFVYLQDMGYECYEINGKDLVDQTAAVQQASTVTGMPVLTACGGYRGWIGDFIEERRLFAIEDLKTILRALQDIGGTGVVVPAAWGMFTYRLPPMKSPRTREGDRKALLDSLSQLDPVAEEYGQYIYLEPLNRYQDHMLNTLSDAAELIQAGGFRRVKITADFYHMSIEEDNISRSLRKYANLIGHIHIAENHRYQPGSGSIDFPQHMRTLHEIGYEGPVVNEGRLRGDPVHACQESIAYMQPMMKAAGVIK